MLKACGCSKVDAEERAKEKAVKADVTDADLQLMSLQTARIKAEARAKVEARVHGGKNQGQSWGGRGQGIPMQRF